MSRPPKRRSARAATLSWRGIVPSHTSTIRLSRSPHGSFPKARGNTRRVFRCRSSSRGHRSGYSPTEPRSLPGGAAMRLFARPIKPMFLRQGGIRPSCCPAQGPTSTTQTSPSMTLAGSTLCGQTSPVPKRASTTTWRSWRSRRPASVFRGRHLPPVADDSRPDPRGWRLPGEPDYAKVRRTAVQGPSGEVAEAEALHAREARNALPESQHRASEKVRRANLGDPASRRAKASSYGVDQGARLRTNLEARCSRRLRPLRRHWHQGGVQDRGPRGPCRHDEGSGRLESIPGGCALGLASDRTCVLSWPARGRRPHRNPLPCPALPHR